MVNIAMIRAREWANKQEAEERAEKIKGSDMPCTYDESIDDHDRLN